MKGPTFKQGWNQIGDPYPFNVDWEQVKAANPSAGLNSFFGFESGSYVKKDVLAAWRAGFVFSDNGGTVIFPVTSKTLNGGRKQSEFSDNVDDEKWLLPLRISVNGISTESAVDPGTRNLRTVPESAARTRLRMRFI